MLGFQSHIPSTESTRNSTHKIDNSEQQFDKFEQTVMNFCRTMEACSAEQHLVANEVWKSFITFVEEILLAFHIKIGPSDAINVKQLLFQDLVGLISYLQSEQQETIISYLTRLQVAKEDRLSSLHRTVTMYKDNLKVAENEVLRKKMQGQEKVDIMDFMTMTTSIIRSLMIKPYDSNLNSLIERMKKHRGTFSFNDEEMDVEEINKRNLGKMIVRYIGHEGVDAKQDLRRLLQACIDFLQTEADGVWKNASITIYDEDDNVYTIASGTRKHQFICSMQNGEPLIKKLKSVSGHKTPKLDYKSSTETTHDRSQKEHDSRCSIS